jgi:Ca2+-transporting ATPase
MGPAMDAGRAAVTLWHTLGRGETAERLGVDHERGLSSREVLTRRAACGENTLREGRRRTVAGMFARQFRDFMILVLVAAAVVSASLGELRDAVAIVAIVVLNAVVGVVQEFRAERAVAALRALAAPTARVQREGTIQDVAASELVPGDVALLEAGDAVPADLRLLDVAGLETDESALTGESRPTSKTNERVAAADAPLGDRRDMAFKGTVVTRGHARGVVVGTGMETEIGRIADLLRDQEDSQTPLQLRLARFGRRLAASILIACAIILVAGLLRGEPLVLMFLTAVSLAVAAIPEALPAVVTISLAFGARRMSRRRALVRRLPAVETLGSVTFICSDKTGTLTENRMRAEVFVVGPETLGEIPADWREHPGWTGLLRAMALSNDVVRGDDEGMLGDPTEVALYEAARAAGLDKSDLESDWPRIAEIGFDSDRKRMSTLHRIDGEAGPFLFTKGAPEAVLPACGSVVGSEARLDRAAWLERAEALADEGYRVLALASRRCEEGIARRPHGEWERDLTLLGLVGLIDPPRPEAAAAVRDCAAAGITPVMITGDHPGTARAIARRLGIERGEGGVVTGPELARMSDDELAARVEGLRVYARVDPAQKIRVVQALQECGQFVAMTGDGVNDAPALKRADIGVAMGQKGTDVAREAADMVLLDDDFATIVTAVREGRRIFDNIRKFIKDTMSSNSGEIGTLLAAPLLGLPLPLLPIHILWINLVTDGLPGLAFTAEPAERDVMQRPPRAPAESIFARGMWQHIVWVGIFVSGLSLFSQAWAIGRGVEYWQTVVFTVLTVSQLFHSMAVRSERESLFRLGIMSNPAMLGAVLLALALQLAVIYVPILHPVFHTQPLPAMDLAVCLGLSALTLVAVEIEKLLVRRGLLYSSHGQAGSHSSQ